ncbi:MAG: Mur ligase domain-containing protein, partial [Bacteroidaceae bacterium]|nr:Mur ligase domain-containing protein [Bacteroidaceae bacterium]
MELKDIKSVYFVGIGGIGMSAIARYFLHMGVPVGGYDKTPSALTAKLEEEGAQIHYEDDLTQVPQIFLSPESTLVVYTPAIPSSHTELTHFFHHGFTVQKRAQVLGTLSQSLQALRVAGTHGKTTTSSMAAHILHQ